MRVSLLALQPHALNNNPDRRCRWLGVEAVVAGKNTLHEAVVGCAGFELPAGTEAGDDGEKRSVELSNGLLKLDKIGVGVETRD